MSETCSDVATALPVMDWVMMASCCAIAVASELSERMLAATDASIGAATLALAATAPLIGAARSASRSTLTSTLSRSPFSRSPVLSPPMVSVTSSTISPTVPMTLPAASRTCPVSGSRVPITLPAEFDDVAGRAVEGADDVAGRVQHGGAVDQVGDGAEHVARRVQDIARSAGPGLRRRCPEASSTLPVAPSRTPMTSPVESATDAPSIRLVTRADDLARGVDDQPGGLVERADDVAARVDHVPGRLVEGADDVAGGVHHEAAVHGLARGRGGGVRGVRRPPVSAACSPPVPSVGVGRRYRRWSVSDWSMVLSWMPVAIASASTVWVTMTPWSASAWRGGVVGQQVGAHRGVDRRHDVGVQGDGEVDGCGPVDGEVDVRREVEDRDDLLVRQRGHPFGGQFLGCQRCQVLPRPCPSLLGPPHPEGPAPSRLRLGPNDCPQAETRFRPRGPYPGSRGLNHSTQSRPAYRRVGGATFALEGAQAM